MTEIRLVMDVDKAERYTETNADLLCWLRGFMAGRSNEDGNLALVPEAVNALSLLNADIKDAISRAKNTAEEQQL